MKPTYWSTKTVKKQGETFHPLFYEPIGHFRIRGRRAARQWGTEMTHAVLKFRLLIRFEIQSNCVRCFGGTPCRNNKKDRTPKQARKWFLKHVLFYLLF